MKTGICQICQKSFKLTRLGKMHRHGYKMKKRTKKWSGFIYEIVKNYYKLTQKPCKGTGFYPIPIAKKEEGDLI